jgi:hypothetical protein
MIIQSANGRDTSAILGSSDYYKHAVSLKCILKGKSEPHRQDLNVIIFSALLAADLYHLGTFIIHCIINLRLQTTISFPVNSLISTHHTSKITTGTMSTTRTSSLGSTRNLLHSGIPCFLDNTSCRSMIHHCLLRISRNVRQVDCNRTG